jgi:RNA polymerase sigma factor (sigma-70 family)
MLNQAAAVLEPSESLTVCVDDRKSTPPQPSPCAGREPGIKESSCAGSGPEVKESLCADGGSPLNCSDRGALPAHGASLTPGPLPAHGEDWGGVLAHALSTAVVPTREAQQAGTAKQSEADENWRDSAAIDALAQTYRDGDRTALGTLHAALRPIIQSSIARTFQLGPLPGPLESRDLEQQSWILLAELAARWDPLQAPFLPYVHGAFPWALRRYLRSQSSDRRSVRTRVISTEHAELFSRADAQTGVDGRDWDNRLMCDEVMTELTSEHQQALQLHFAERRRPAEVASAMGVSIEEVEPLVKRAVRAARAVASGRRPPDQQADLRLLVETLHAGAGPQGRLPGRSWVCTETGLSELRFARLMRVLVATDCIVGRSARVAGRLRHQTAEATLAAATGE